MAIQKALARHNREQPTNAIHVRIGINAGEPISTEGRLFGTAVHRAFRICARARARTDPRLRRRPSARRRPGLRAGQPGAGGAEGSRACPSVRGGMDCGDHVEERSDAWVTESRDTSPRGRFIRRSTRSLNRQDQPGGPFVRRAAFLAALMKASDGRGLPGPHHGRGQRRAATRWTTCGNTWYSTAGWWTALQPIYPILQQGLIKTIQEAGDQLLIDSYWLPGLGATGVEVIVARSPRQVTRLIITPPSMGPWPTGTLPSRCGS